MAETGIDDALKQRGEIDRLPLKRLINQGDVRLYRPGFLDKLSDFLDEIAKRRIICDDCDRTSPL